MAKQRTAPKRAASKANGTASHDCDGKTCGSIDIFGQREESRPHDLPVACTRHAGRLLVAATDAWATRATQSGSLLDLDVSRILAAVHMLFDDANSGDPSSAKSAARIRRLTKSLSDCSSDYIPEHRRGIVDILDAMIAWRFQRGDDDAAIASTIVGSLRLYWPMLPSMPRLRRVRDDRLPRKVLEAVGAARAELEPLEQGASALNAVCRALGMNPGKAHLLHNHWRKKRTLRNADGSVTVYVGTADGADGADPPG